MRRNVLLLAICQALYMTGTSTVLTVTAVAGARLAPTPLLATLPFSLQFLATMATTIPASLLMRRIGRRRGFLIGTGIGATAASIAAWGLASNAFALFALGSGLIGVLNGFAVFYRFAAADAADDAFRSRAISLVMAGGVIAAFTGPNLARVSADWIAAAPFAGSFAAVVVVHITAMVVLFGINIPHDRAGVGAGSGRPLPAIVRDPVFATALGAAAAGYAAMNLIMTATPPAMLAHGHTFSDAAFVIQWHIVGMFAPAFLTGSLIARFGATRIIAAGAALIIACVAINLAGRDSAHFVAALALLGVGWNFMFVAATALIGSAHTAAEKAKVQGINDFVVFSAVALASFSSGALEATIGWSAVNLAVVLPVAVAGAAAVWLGGRRRRAVPG
ncbi:MAG: MFS transporter [Gemmatimonas sp.]